jgi:FkbM family methyltransferase
MSDARTAIGRFIRRHRRSRAVGRLYRVARFVESAYANVGSDVGENGEVDVLRRLARFDFNTVFDVGANVGDWSVQALTCWPSARVHAFEVARPTFDALQANIERQDFMGRTTLNHCGFGDRSGARTMFYYPDHPELTCDEPRHDGLTATEFNAEFITGDSYVDRSAIDRIDFMKIDVEGAEHLVLDGLSATIDQGRVRCIQFEYGAFSIGTRFLLRDYYGLLASRYWIGKIFPTGVEFSDYSWTSEDFRFANFLCVSRDQPDVKRAAEGSS